MSIHRVRSVVVGMDTETAQEASAAEEDMEQALSTINTSLGFLLVIIAGLIFSFIATARQRESICCAIAGETEKAAALADVFPLRCKASALTIGASGFFLCLAIQGAKKPEATATAAARCSTYRNIWVALLFLVAEMVRLLDLVDTKQLGGASIAEDVQPD